MAAWRRRLAVTSALMLAGGCASLSGLSSGGGADGGAPVDARRGDVTVSKSGMDASKPDHDARDASPRTDDVAASEAGCFHAAPVAAPTETSPGTKDLAFVVAVEAFTSGLAVPIGDGGALGFDLDHTCTCPGPPSCGSPSANCDLEPGGHDLAGNAFAQLFQQDLATTSEGDINARVASGLYTILFYVSNYNGGPNDSDVLVGIMTSSGTTSGATPTWDGTDAWNVDPTTAIAAMGDDGGTLYTPTYLTTTAYVNNYTLVAELPTLTVGVALGTIDLTQAIPSLPTCVRHLSPRSLV